MGLRHRSSRTAFRFAPSPTGALHIGGARTALYNWLLARGSGGELVLRIEDTDRERSTPENVEQILDALRWLELDWDEGPISQASRAQRHAERLAELLDSGAAYRDTAGAQDVQAYKQIHGADRGYRGTPTDEDGAAIRLRVPDEGETVVQDVIRGPVSFPNSSYDDFVIARGDGSVLYNFAVAVDDADMAITDVVRGDDHLSNTPKQLLVLRGARRRAAPLRPPAAAARPRRQEALQAPRRGLGAGAARRRLPPRGRPQLPGAARLGGRRRRDPDLDAGADRAVRPGEGRALGGDLRRAQAALDQRPLHARAAARSLRRGRRRARGREPDEALRAACAIAQEKAQTLAEVWPLIGFLFEEPVDDPDAWRKTMKEGTGELLGEALAALRGVEPFEAAAIETALAPVVEGSGGKAGKVYQPIRVAITGTTISPGIFESLAALGKEHSLARIEAALSRLKA